LLFINRQDQAQITYQSDQEKYNAKSLVKNRVMVADSDGEPLSGSFSVAVTSDKAVKPDSTSNILTHLLLTSDLRGYIENPTYYFQNTKASNLALDLLMLTQGWRRYDIATLTHGYYSHPAWPIETGAEISGTVKSVLLHRPVEDIEVNVISTCGKYINKCITNTDGRFFLNGGELPDSATFIVSAIPPKRTTRLDLFIDKETFPERKLSINPAYGLDKMQFAKYADKAKQQYTHEGGEHVIQLTELNITAQLKKSNIKQTFLYETSPNLSITEEQLDRNRDPDIRNLLRQLPGVSVSDDYTVFIRGMYDKAILVLDNMPMETENLELISVFDIAQIDVVKGTSAAIFGMRGAGGAIAIYTKDPKSSKVPPPSNTKTINPLGYQSPVEFYAPKYDTSEKRNAKVPDLRTTIHWQPIVRVDSLGVALFEFYTADETTSYMVIIEGLTDNGKIIRQEAKLWRKD